MSREVLDRDRRGFSSLRELCLALLSCRAPLGAAYSVVVRRYLQSACRELSSDIDQSQRRLCDSHSRCAEALERHVQECLAKLQDRISNLQVQGQSACPDSESLAGDTLPMKLRQTADQIRVLDRCIEEAARELEAFLGHCSVARGRDTTKSISQRPMSSWMFLCGPPRLTSL